MRGWLKERPVGVDRVLASGAAWPHRRMMLGKRMEQYRNAYNYLRKRILFLDYSRYRNNHLPIGSGVTEASMPGRCAAPPAPAMITRSPRPAADSP